MNKYMEIVVPNGGWIEAICGPMFSGKTEELIRRLRRAKIARKRVQVFKPAADDRYSADEIVSHASVRMRSEPVGSAQEILDNLNWKTEVVGIDESHFFGPELVDVANYLADNGKQVIVAGLDTDFMGRPFPPMPALLAIAESITKTLAICMRCGAPAKHSQRLVDSGELILAGSTDAYESRCRQCFEPGIPRQASLNFPQTAAAADLLNGT
jgi:thymidine kinase